MAANRLEQYNRKNYWLEIDKKNQYMATVKVFIPTYRRNNTLVRSIDSLLKQTFANWICEVHNDDPADEYPESYVAGLNDTRFSIINYPVNLGAVKTFNLSFGR